MDYKTPVNSAILPPNQKGVLDMPAKAKLRDGRYWYIEINHKGESKTLTQWRNTKFNQDTAPLIEGIINQQILSGHFRWDDWFPRMGKKYQFQESYWVWFDFKQRSPATRQNIKYKFQHFKPLHSRDVRHLQQHDFTFIRELHGDTHKAKAIRQVGQAFVNWCWHSGMLERQIFLPPISVPKRKTPYLPLDARWAIYDGMCEPYKAPMLLGLEMGMRIGEICALQWGDIDWENEGINVCHTMSAYQLKESRKEGDEVWLPISQKVKDCLLVLKSKRPVIAGFVFTHPSGKQIWTQQLSSSFRQSCRKIGLPNAKFHHLRNSFLHDLSEAGATTREASALAGHRSERSTERYIGRWSKTKVKSIAHLRPTAKAL